MVIVKFMSASSSHVSRAKLVVSSGGASSLSAREDGGVQDIHGLFIDWNEES